MPVEIQVEKELGLSGKDDIERYGVEEFNRLCRESVFRYVADWREMSDRMAYWVDMDHPYRTLDNSYIESVWWALKELRDKDLLYEGYKVGPHCPRDQTSLSSPRWPWATSSTPTRSSTRASTPRCRWPTRRTPTCSPGPRTPWTLISNAAVAVNPDVDYAVAEVDGEAGGERLILAQELLEKVLGEMDYRVLSTVKGRELEGRPYRRVFDEVSVGTDGDPENLWTVVLGDYVTTTEGTGLVQIAPAFGEDDASSGRSYDLPTIHPVRPDGTFDEWSGRFAGKFVKDADSMVVDDLREQWPALPRGGLRARLPPLLALRHAAPLLRQEGLVCPHDAPPRRAARGERGDRTGSPNTSSGAASGTGSGTT